MTLLVRNVRIIGGARDFPESTDVFIANEKISAIGSFPDKGADLILDGQGAYLSPGFIDVNTDSDHYFTLFDYPEQADFLRQGVTTIFGGMCGSSLAPLLYGSLESVRKWANVERVNVIWHTIAEFLAALEGRSLAVNFGTFAGHSTIRRAIVGEELRDLTPNERTVFADILRTSLDEGAFGFSTGLAYVHSQSTPYAEIKSFADIVMHSHGMYATHLRNMAEGIKESVEETVRVAKEAKIPTLISHFVPAIGSESQYQSALGIIEALPREMPFRFDIYPFASTLVPIYTFLPLWVKTGGLEVMLLNVKDEVLLSRIRKDLPEIDEQHFIVAEAPGNDFLVGKSLRDIRQMYGLEGTGDALLRLMAATSLRGTILYKNLNLDLVKQALKSPRSFVASNAPSFSDADAKRRLKSERTTSTFTKFLSLVFEENLMPLEEAIRKITIEPARFMGLRGRGEIKEGNFADLVCFKDSQIKFTIVNGVLVHENGEFKGKFPGKVFRAKRAS